jgi:hypothetical protein
VFNESLNSCRYNVFFDCTFPLVIVQMSLFALSVLINVTLLMDVDGLYVCFVRVLQGCLQIQTKGLREEEPQTCFLRTCAIMFVTSLNDVQQRLHELIVIIAKVIVHSIK